MRLDDKRVLVTGGAGFLGRHVVAGLVAAGVREVIAPRRREFDLTREEDVERIYLLASPDIVVHLAAVVGGIGANRDNPGRFFYENLMMGALLMEHARRAGVAKFATVGTICSYPKHTPVPFKEEHLWNGYPEESNAPYGLAKKMLLVQGQAYRRQYGFNAIHLLPVNLYGPRDNFDLATAHVIPSLIRKVQASIDADRDHVVCWGDGSPTREFLYVQDAAEAIVSAVGRYDGAAPINIGTGREITIRELAELIAELMGFDGEIRWDTGKPNGQPRRCVDTSRAERLLGFTASTRLEDGLRRTIDWYRAGADDAARTQRPGLRAVAADIRHRDALEPKPRPGADAWRTGGLLAP